ncbi:MAG: RidA family protein [Thermoplasmata archaeon]|nr:RidA family protein [Thermoplasmata archaeon]
MPPRRTLPSDELSERVRSGGPWEERFGYVRAIRIGRRVLVSGTTAARPDGSVEGGSSLAEQTAAALRRIDQALHTAGAGLPDVVRTRVFVTDIRRWTEVAEAHRLAFGRAPPVSTLVEVRRLIREDLLVEIEAEAYVAPKARPTPRAGRSSARGRRPGSGHAPRRPS